VSMLLISWLASLVTDWFASKCQLPDGFVSNADPTIDPHYMLPAVVRSNKLYIVLMVASYVSVSIYTIGELQANATHSSSDL